MAEMRAECKRQLAARTTAPETILNTITIGPEGQNEAANADNNQHTWKDRGLKFLWGTGCVISYFFSVSVLLVALGMFLGSAGPTVVQACSGELCGHNIPEAMPWEQLGNLVQRTIQGFHQAGSQQ